MIDHKHEPVLEEWRDYILESRKKTETFKKEDEEMNEEKVLTPEERIEQLEKEKAELQLQIKNQKEYKILKEYADNIALAMKAFTDSGFTRSEAMELLKMALLPYIK